MRTRTEAPCHAAGGSRLAVVNAWNLQAGLAGREILRTHFLARAA
jgi:hypothetical protein